LLQRPVPGEWVVIGSLEGMVGAARTEARRKVAAEAMAVQAVLEVLAEVVAAVTPSGLHTPARLGR
jgi:hypothetical protein